ncbi:hypothetical protein IMG5_166950 [Ichthyophthirius multifiliis]|uniref:NOT2/NOT3/NOT5 C-terminal domain-containing protein n=1 Tax=Ichthyophthirius multifiliis TaxID=5932 RepID=G0R0U1_ICHMU|nr:hypothetical protein IMG5_166950 [Ichthyophthirius multifiliis]EGR28901.1 hypothetical protein IMG5_166950 [Ichthyophthirius multifiliis]|eukprot:XP_004030137.1 hypothetical protein IMG5_166950 [Ichthyophthirius multifiliis]
MGQVNSQMMQKQAIEINDSLKKKFSLKNKIEELIQVPPEMQIFVFGIDIPNIGISNLSQDQQIHPTFGSPFAENPTIKVDSMNYEIPTCYTKPAQSSNEQLFKKFPDETLLYIFYNVPEEYQQLQAVSELFFFKQKLYFILIFFQIQQKLVVQFCFINLDENGKSRKQIKQNYLF